MAKATHVNVNGTWKEIKNVWEKVDGVWKEKVMPKLNVLGTIKECMSYGEEVLYHVTKPGATYDVEIFDKDSLIVLSTLFASSAMIRGIGGINQRLYSSGYDSGGLWRERNVDNGAILNSVTSVPATPTSMGGTVDRVSSSEYTIIYEVDPDLLTVINSRGQGTKNFEGTGGIIGRLYGADRRDDNHVEFNIDTLSVINTVNKNQTSLQGIGGNNTRLYGGNGFYNEQALWELDLDTLAIINTKNIFGTQITAVGGIKNI